MHRPFTTVARLACAAAAVLALAGTAACGPDHSPPVVSTLPPSGLAGGGAPPTTTTAAAAASPWPTDSAGNPVGWQVCRNATHHFSIAYPAGWHTASAGADDQCALFDPAAFTVVDGAPALVTQQLHAYYQSMDLLEYFQALFPVDFFTVVSEANVMVAPGVAAIRYTVTTLPPRGPSGPTYPVGTTLYGYVVTAGARSIDVGTWAAPTDASLLPARQHIVDQAVTTVRWS
jgi:hypothetical protein